jgi:hypothetical protein
MAEFNHISGLTHFPSNNSDQSSAPTRCHALRGADFWFRLSDRTVSSRNFLHLKAPTGPATGHAPHTRVACDTRNRYVSVPMITSRLKTLSNMQSVRVWLMRGSATSCHLVISPENGAQTMAKWRNRAPAMITIPLATMSWHQRHVTNCQGFGAP